MSEPPAENRECTTVLSRPSDSPARPKVFWLISFLLPGSRRNSGDPPFDNFSHLISSPQSRGLFFKIIGLVAAVGLLWLLIAAILSLINAWVVIGLAAVMGTLVAIRQWQTLRRENWIQTGCCAQCGYDLRATPRICPECGRDARLDEPTWRRVRRELEAKLLASAPVEHPAEIATPKPLTTSEPHS
jgi:hypothetical protein